jgi:hypothetical protein
MIKATLATDTDKAVKDEARQPQPPKAAVECGCSVPEAFPMCLQGYESHLFRELVINVAESLGGWC